MIPITASTRFKSGIAILWNLVSAIMCEINSSLMEDTIAKLFANLIDLLRYIRHFDPSVASWVGFVFPKNEVKSNNNFACEVKVVWHECKFVCNVTCLKMEDIKAKVQNIFTTQIKVVKQLRINLPATRRFLVPLSTDDLEFIQEKLCITSLVQVESKSSILLKNEENYFKFPGNVLHQTALTDLVLIYNDMNPIHQVQCTKHLVLPIKMLRDKSSGNVFFPLPFFVLPAMKYQLTKDIAKQCLPDLADGIIEGLKALHKLHLAHLDVRLPNVCVGEDFQVKLIDFDRSSSSSDVAEYGRKFMYTYEMKERIVQYLDWKQFGLLLFTLSSYNGDKHQSELNKDDIPLQCPFLNELIFHHKYDSNLMNVWNQSLRSNQKLQLSVVLH